MLHDKDTLERTVFTNPEFYLPAFFMQLSESVTENIVPFDATSETPLEEQRTEAMVRVQDALLARLGPEALGLLRAARSVRLHHTMDTCFVFLLVFTSFYLLYSGRYGLRGTCLVRLMWNLRKNWNFSSRSSMLTCQVSCLNLEFSSPLDDSICTAFKQ